MKNSKKKQTRRHPSGTQVSQFGFNTKPKLPWDAADVAAVAAGVWIGVFNPGGGAGRIGAAGVGASGGCWAGGGVGGTGGELGTGGTPALVPTDGVYPADGTTRAPHDGHAIAEVLPSGISTGLKHCWQYCVIAPVSYGSGSKCLAIPRQTARGLTRSVSVADSVQSCKQHLLSQSLTEP